MEQGSRPPAPPEFSESRSWGEGPHPHPEVSKGSERGASLAHPHPQSDTPGARRERGRRGAPNNKERSGERQPLPREVGGRRRAALPVPSPGASLLLPSRPPPGWGVRCGAAAAAWAGVTVTPASPGISPNTQTHTVAAGVIRTATRRGGEDKGSED